jgi:hypothetical protein
MSASADATTGTMLLRQTLRNRNRKMHLAKWARDLNVGTGTLEAFAEQGCPLSDAAKDALTKMLFGDSASFDPVTDRLVRAKPETRSLGVAPSWSLDDDADAYPPRTTPHQRPGAPGPRLLKPSAPPSRPAPRPGWSD